MAGILTRRWPRSFADRVTAPLPRPSQFLRLWREGGFAGATEGVERIPVTTRSPLPISDAWLMWLGHASFLLRLSRLIVAVDPVLPVIERTRTAWAVAGRDRADLWDLAVGESRPL